MDPPKGFVADDVRDWKPYGLDKPRLRVEVENLAGDRESIAIGANLPKNPDRAYARRGDQNDVVVINAGGLDKLGVRAIDFRSPKIADFDPRKIQSLEVQSQGVTSRLSKNDEGALGDRSTGSRQDRSKHVEDFARPARSP